MKGGLDSNLDESENENKYSDSLGLYNRFRDASTEYLLPPLLFSRVQTALDIIEQGIRLYGPLHIFASYNGGKDAVAIMHLFRAALANFVQKKKEEDQQKKHIDLLDDNEETRKQDFEAK